jgi:uncharacterized protein
VIWILWHRRVGDLQQMQALATALNMPFEIKKLHFRKPYYAPLANYMLDQDGSDKLMAPSPTVILCAEALCSVVARKLKRASANTIKIVVLARPSGTTTDFDLVLTTPQYRLPKAGNIVELRLPLLIAPQSYSAGHSGTTAVLIGATSPPDILDNISAERIIVDLKSYADRSRKILQVVTSPRTDPEVAKILKQSIVTPHHVHVWKADGQNPYQNLLNQAEEIIVTSDSVSMLADAVATHNPVQIYRLPRRLSFLQRRLEKLYLRHPDHFLFATGLIEPTTNRWVLIDRLVSDGYVNWFGDTRKPTRHFESRVDLDTAVDAVQKLFANKT